MKSSENYQIELFSQEASRDHASHFPLPGSKEARRTTATSGRRCYELYPKSGPLGLLQKMLLESSNWHSTKRYLTWKVKATKQSRLIFQLAVSMPRISDSEYGLWATPCSMDHMNPKTDKAALKEATEIRPGRTNWCNLRDQVTRGKTINKDFWPTPRNCTAMSATITPESVHAENRFPNLETVVGQRMWPTPTVQDSQNNAGPSQFRRNSLPLNAAAGGTLNPTWVEWLQGYPLNWTDIGIQNQTSQESQQTKIEIEPTDLEASETQ